MSTPPKTTPSQGIATKRELAAAGWSDQQLLNGVRNGTLLRLRRGWYAHPEASTGAMLAIRAGGLLTSSSLTQALGLWTVDDNRVHVALAANASRLTPVGAETVLHWGYPVERPNTFAVTDTLPNALAHIARHSALADSVVTIDSALNSGLLHPEDWMRVLASLSPSKQVLGFHVDGHSQSGLESRCRLSLRSRRIRVRIQVAIAGVGIVDVLVGDRLVVELDGERYHSGPVSFENDRRRDLELARLGYRIIRLSYAQVMNHWPYCESVILRLVRAGEHNWRPSSRRYFD